MRRFERLPVEEIRRRQWNSLSRMLHHAYEKVPFYRERFEQAGLRPADIRTPEDLRRFPITTRQDVDTNFPDRITTRSAQDNCRLVATSGTTSQRMIALQDFAKREAVRAAFAHSFKFCGLPMGSRFVEIPPDICAASCGVNREPEPPLLKYVSRLNYRKWKEEETWSDIRGMVERQMIHRQLVINSFGADGTKQDEAACAEYLERIRSYRPLLLKALPAYLLILARYIRRNGLTPPAVKEIRPMGSALVPSVRKIIEEAFQCKVVEDYGSAELGSIGCECCSGNGMHLFSDLFYLEFVKNGAEAGLEETGRILVTDLSNRVMPLIRYDIGDLGHRIPGRCLCGRNTMRFRVLGRVQDAIVSAAGHVFTEHSLADFFYTYPGVEWFQIAQLGRDRLDLRIVPDNQTPIESRSLIKHLQNFIGGNVRITFRQTKTIAPETGGKFRFIKASKALELQAVSNGKNPNDSFL